MGKPIIRHTLEALPKKIDEVVIVEPENGCISRELDTRDLRFEVEFRKQKEPRGTWEAILIGAKDCDSDFLVLSAHHFSTDAIERVLKGRGMKLLFSQVDNPRDYGVGIFDEGRLVGIMEKPERPPSNLALNSIYLFSPEFVRLLEKISRRRRDEHMLEEALSLYASEHEVEYEVIPKEEVPSLKYPWHALQLMKKLVSKARGRVDGDVSESAVIESKVVIEEGAKVMENAVIKGPAYIGRGAVIGTGALVREACVEEKAVVGFSSEVARSILSRGVKLHHNYVGDSVLGENVRMGYGAVTANRRMDGKPVKAMVNGRKVVAGEKFGCAIGKGTSIGVNAMIMPGVLIGRETKIYPGVVVKENIPDRGCVRW